MDNQTVNRRHAIKLGLLASAGTLLADPFDSYSPTQFVPYLDTNEGYSRIDYQWYLRNTGQTSYCFQNGLIFPSLTEQGGGYDAGIFRAWDIQNNATGVRVAVIDSGCNDNFSELAGVISAGYHIDDRNKIYNSDYADYNGHGTAIASIIGARANGEQMVGVAPGVSLLAVQTRYATSEITKGIHWAIDNGAHVICLSWGETSVVDADLRPLMAACLRASDNQVVIVSAVRYGGNLEQTPTYPYAWALPNYLAVAGLYRDGTFFTPSATGLQCIGAPARVIVQLSVSGVVGYSSGNSFASPIVAGAVALHRARSPGKPAAHIVRDIKTAARKHPVPGIAGRFDASQFGKL